MVTFQIIEEFDILIIDLVDLAYLRLQNYWFRLQKFKLFARSQDQDVEDTWEIVKSLRNLAGHASKALFVTAICSYLLLSIYNSYV